MGHFEPFIDGVLWLLVVSLPIAIAFASASATYQLVSSFYGLNDRHVLNRLALIALPIAVVAASLLLQLPEGSWEVCYAVQGYDIDEWTGLPPEVQQQETIIISVQILAFLSWLLIALTQIFALILTFKKSLGRLKRIRSESTSYPNVQNVLVSKEVAEPITMGLHKPFIVLPSRAVEQLSSDEIGAVIEHEYAHIVRRDPLKNLCLQVVRAVFWFNLPLHFLIRQYENSREFDCDKRAIANGADRFTLAIALSRLAIDVAERRTVLTLGGHYGHVADRIKSLAADTNPRGLNTIVAFFVAIGTLLLALQIFRVLLTNGVDFGVVQDIRIQGNG